MTTLIPGNQQVLTYRDIRTALGFEATVELLDRLRAEPSLGHGDAVLKARHSDFRGEQ